MSVSYLSVEDGPYYPNGVATTFGFGFGAAALDQIRVVRRVGDDDTVVVSTLYSVSFESDGEGGSVHFTVPPVAAGGALYVQLIPSFEQETRLTNSGFLPATVNPALDRGARRDIYLRDLIGRLEAVVSRAILVSFGETPPSYDELADILRGAPGLNGGTSDLAAFIGLFTGAAGQNLTAGGTKPAPEAVLTHGYRKTGRVSRYLRWAAPLAALPAVGAGENAWWFADSQGNKYYPDPSDLHFEQFGAYTDGNPDYNAASDDYPAFLALKSYLVWAGKVWSGSYTNAPVVQMPLGIGYSSDTWVFDFATVHLRGAPGTQNGSAGYSLKFAPGKTGITIKLKGVGSTFYGIDLWSTGLGGVATADGWHMRAASQLIDCSAWNFSQDGVNALASVGGSGDGQGNNNLFRILGGNYHHNGRDGIHPQGGDANVYDIRDANLAANGGWGFGGDDFLGGMVLNCHTDVNGVKTLAGTTFAPNTGTTMCSYSGNLYQRIRGQEVGASTNAPSGTATHNAYWRYMLPGGVSTIYPAWVSGMLVIDGGPYLAGQASSHTLFIACYSEGTQAASYFDNNTFAIGGLHAAGIIGAHLDMADGSIFCAQGIGTRVVNADTSATTARFGTPNNPGSTLMAYGRSALGTVDYAWNMDAEGNNYHDYGAAGGPTATRYVTGAGTTLNFGRSVAQPHKEVSGEIFLGSLGNGARAMTMAGATPTGPHAKGEIVWNDYSVATTPEYWRCTGSGTPGTWVAH